MESFVHSFIKINHPPVHLSHGRRITRADGLHDDCGPGLLPELKHKGKLGLIEGPLLRQEGEIPTSSADQPSDRNSSHVLNIE